MPSVPVTQAALVVGGGVAGMVSALTLANQGFQACIVEAKDKLGGHALHLRNTWKGENAPEYIQNLVREVGRSENIKVFLNSTVRATSGYIGNFSSTVASNGQQSEIAHGVTILATGAHSLEPEEYLYGKERPERRVHPVRRLPGGGPAALQQNMLYVLGSEGHRAEKPQPRNGRLHHLP